MSEPKPVVYLAGPMSGVPKFNFPFFDAVTRALRAEGFTVISPHELDSPETQKAARASKDGKVTKAMESWGDCLARDVKLLADGIDLAVEVDGEMKAFPERTQIDTIALLDGWEKSRGARLEAFVGLQTGKAYAVVVPQSDGVILSPRTAEWVEHMLASQWNGVRVYRTGAE